MYKPKKLLISTVLLSIILSACNNNVGNVSGLANQPVKMQSLHVQNEIDNSNNLNEENDILTHELSYKFLNVIDGDLAGKYYLNSQTILWLDKDSNLRELSGVTLSDEEQTKPSAFLSYVKMHSQNFAQLLSKVKNIIRLGDTSVNTYILTEDRKLYEIASDNSNLHEINSNIEDVAYDYKTEDLWVVKLENNQLQVLNKTNDSNTFTMRNTIVLATPQPTLLMPGDNNKVGDNYTGASISLNESSAIVSYITRDSFMNEDGEIKPITKLNNYSCTNNIISCENIEQVVLKDADFVQNNSVSTQTQEIIELLAKNKGGLATISSNEPLEINYDGVDWAKVGIMSGIPIATIIASGLLHKFALRKVPTTSILETKYSDVTLKILADTSSEGIKVRKNMLAADKGYMAGIEKIKQALGVEKLSETMEAQLSETVMSVYAAEQTGISEYVSRNVFLKGLLPLEIGKQYLNEIANPIRDGKIINTDNISSLLDSIVKNKNKFDEYFKDSSSIYQKVYKDTLGDNFIEQKAKFLKIINEYNSAISTDDFSKKDVILTKILRGEAGGDLPGFLREYVATSYLDTFFIQSGSVKPYFSKGIYFAGLGLGVVVDAALFPTVFDGTFKKKQLVSMSSCNKTNTCAVGTLKNIAGSIIVDNDKHALTLNTGYVQSTYFTTKAPQETYEFKYYHISNDFNCEMLNTDVKNKSKTTDNPALINLIYPSGKTEDLPIMDSNGNICNLTNDDILNKIFVKLVSNSGI